MSERAPSPVLKIRTHERFDGSVWRQYESPDSLIILTGEGRRLIGAGGISSLLHRYIDDLVVGKETPADTRQYLAKGGNARVFSVGDKKLVIKEALPKGDQLWPALERMDTLIDAVQKHCPRWVDVPHHYGLLISKHDFNRQFLLMDKIDEGVTAWDILHYGEQDREPHLKESAERIFGPITPELQAEVASRYHELTGELRQALVYEHLSPDQYLPDIDYKPDNIVLEKLRMPIAGSNIRYWVIDQ